MLELRDMREESHSRADGSRPVNDHKPSPRPKNWLEAVVLVTLREMNSYGYELMHRAAAFGLEAMNPGTLYRTLRHLEKEGLCESRWETSGSGPARRMYSITDAGEAYLDFWAESLKQYQRTVDAFFRLYRGWWGPRTTGKKTDL